MALGALNDVKRKLGPYRKSEGNIASTLRSVTCRGNCNKRVTDMGEGGSNT